MTNRELKNKYQIFLDEYSSSYHKGALEYIRENFWKCRNSFEIPDILMQVYSELGLYDDKTDIYLKHLNKIKSIFNIDCNVLEVAGGMLPAFSNIVAREQLNIGKGTITMYDPMLATTKSKYTNLKLHKKEFTNITDISNYDLIIGILPCDVTEDIIRKSCIERKNFYIQMCGCTHFTPKQIMEYGLSREIYQKYIIDLASNLLGEEINITKIDNKFGIDYPILYKKF